MVLVRGLVGNFEGMKSIDSASGTAVLSLIDLIVFWCMRRWPMMVTYDFTRCLKIRDIARHVQYAKWNFLTAHRKFDGVGLNTHAWKYPARY